MKAHKVIGGAGAHIHVVEAGNPHGRPILFIHGFSQSWLCWSRQFNSDLAGDFRLVALDLRGHGASDKPQAGYDDSKLWADDLHAVIQTLALDRPLLCGWSYGPLVMLDYVRHYGEDKIAGMSFIGGITKLGSAQAAAVITPEFLALVPAFFSNNTEESVRGLQSLLRMCFSRPLEEPDFYHMLGYNLAVPPYVRQALFSRQIDNDDLLARLRKPVLITHAATDAIVRGQVVDQHRAGIAHAEVDVIDGTGHACFWEAPSRFNQRLRTFAQGLDRQSIVAAHTAGNMGE